MGFRKNILWGAFAAATLAFLWVASSTNGSGGPESDDDMKLAAAMADITKLDMAIPIQLARAEGCARSKHAKVCPEGSVMLFAETSFAGSCYPAGCHLAGPPGTLALAGDIEAMRVAAIQQRAAQLVAEKPGTSLENDLRFQAVAFEQGENDNRFRMKKITKKSSRDERDLPALRDLVEEAWHKGFVHDELGKATRILDWETSKAEVVLGDQATARATDKCGRKASGCPRDSFPLVSLSLVGGCEVATCVHVPMGADNPSTLAKKKALEEAAPAAFSAASDLKHFNRLVKVMAKDRKKIDARAKARDMLASAEQQIDARAKARDMLASAEQQIKNYFLGKRQRSQAAGVPKRKVSFRRKRKRPHAEETEATRDRILLSLGAFVIIFCVANIYVLLKMQTNISSVIGPFERFRSSTNGLANAVGKRWSWCSRLATLCMFIEEISVTTPTDPNEQLGTDASAVPTDSFPTPRPKLVGCQSVEVTARQRRLLFAGALKRQPDGRLPKRLMFGELVGGEDPGWKPGAELGEVPEGRL